MSGRLPRGNKINTTEETSKLTTQQQQTNCFLRKRNKKKQRFARSCLCWANLIHCISRSTSSMYKLHTRLPFAHKQNTSKHFMRCLHGEMLQKQKRISNRGDTSSVTHRTMGCSNFSDKGKQWVLIQTSLAGALCYLLHDTAILQLHKLA